MRLPTKARSCGGLAPEDTLITLLGLDSCGHKFEGSPVLPDKPANSDRSSPGLAYAGRGCGDAAGASASRTDPQVGPDGGVGDGDVVVGKAPGYLFGHRRLVGDDTAFGADV